MKRTMHFTPWTVSLLTCGLMAGGVSHAQVAPDAGSSLEMLRKAPQPLPQGPSIPSPAREMRPLQGGATVEVREILLQDNIGLESTVVLAGIDAQATIGQSLNIDGLRALAERITAYYQGQGYPFARAIIPVQDLKDGKLLIQVVEGQYGQVQAKSSDAALAEVAQGFLQSLVKGQTIQSAPLERATLLINDLPGVSVVPVMKPGAQAGAGDLDVLVEQVQTSNASVSVDNHGSRYTGPIRTQFNGAINRALMVGDQLSFTGIMPVQGLWVGNLNYSMPLGSDGWRVQAGLSRLHYKLKEDFDGFNGQADVRSLTLSYPLVRSRTLNATASMAYQDKELKDISTYQSTTKKAHVYPLTLAFDARDGLGLGGLTYGALSAVSGDVDITGNTKSFAKLTFDLARIQQVGEGWSLYGRWFQQTTSSNLDSSEKAMLGGATGVRAYPSGEAAGDKASLLQAELRWNSGTWSPYAFYDYGKVKVDARPELVNLPSPDKTRSGAGLGMRFQSGGISWNAALAWRIQGGVPEADAKTAGAPRIWMEARYAF